MTERVACVRLCAPLLRDVQLWGFHDTFVTVNSSTTEQPNDGRAERGLCGGLNVTCTAFQTSQAKTKQKHTKTKNIYKNNKKCKNKILQKQKNTSVRPNNQNKKLQKQQKIEELINKMTS